MTTAGITARRQAFTTAINNTPDTGNIDTINAQLRANLNQVASRYGVQEFSIDTTQGYSIYDSIIEGLRIGDVEVGGKEQRLDAILGNTETHTNLAHNSREYVAVMSLYYNSEDLITSSTPGGSIASAIINNDRISAWYLMRYRRNGGSSRRGIANRRYRESDLFGLWNSGGPTTTELERFETFLKQVDPYTTSLSTLQLMRNYEAELTPKTIEANNSRTIDDQINDETAVKNYFVSKYGQGQNIDGKVIIGTELANKVIFTTRSFTLSEVKSGYLKSIDKNDLILGEKGNDTLNGGSGNDVIYGGEGKDTLIGGSGIDTLIGGANADKYVIYKNELGSDGSIIDKIIDDGAGDEILIKNAQGTTVETRKVSGNFYKQDNGTWTKILTWAEGTANQIITFMYDAAQSIGKIIMPDNAEAMEIKDFQDGDFGIHLLDTPANPTTTNTIYGDQNPDNPNDALSDTSLNDWIEGQEGNDTINAFGGGDDVLLGGDGRDAISAGYGDDLAEGGSESDIVFGGGGSDQVFGENQGEMETLIAAGETAININEKGDLVAGNDGNDLLYGSNKKDALFGGEGHDLLVGAGGDDVIYGDHDATGAWIDWSFTVANNQANFTNVSLEQDAPAGDDTIYAGTGNDLVYAGGADDEVDAGEGNDTVFGEAGDDFITGAGGNDTLIGDGLHIAASEHGSDYIDGGAGSDTIWGGGGSDDLFGGEGNDYIVGDDGIEGAGDDYIDGEAGDDIIHGSAGSDTLFGGEDNDTLVGDGANDGAGDDYLDGEAGNDTILGAAGTDTLFGGDGDDWLQGDSGNDYIDGEAGADKILGGDGDDEIYGGDGDDVITGGRGSDIIDGGDGNDTIYVSNGDTVEGGTGYDKYIITADDSSGNAYTITDSDGNSKIILNGSQLAGGTGKDGIYTDRKNNIYLWNGSNDSPITVINRTIMPGTTTPGITRININPGMGGPTGFPPSGMSLRFGALPFPNLNGIIGALHQGFTSACSSAAPIRRDPLILDLDGDGIETINVANGAYFDHDANGFAEQTGWVSPDDGLLVRDINGNGAIDSGRELFGDNTLLKNGSLATDGLQALADLDSNGDHKIDAQDAAFNQLKIWKDANSDGISQSSELKTLNDLGIKKILKRRKVLCINSF